MSDFGTKLKELRKSAGLTQQQLSDKLNIHERTVSKWERCVCEPDFAIYGAISEVLSVSLEELWGLSAPAEKINGIFSMEKTGEAISFQRKRLGESQQNLASVLNVSADTVSKWERGLVCPDKDTFLKLSEHFNIQPSKFYYAQTSQTVSAHEKVKSRKNNRLIILLTSFAVLAVIISIVLPVCFLSLNDKDHPPVDAVCEHHYVASVTSPTCSMQGFTDYTCSECGDNYKDDYTAKLAHTAGEWLIEREATCSLEGKRHKDCLICGEELQTESLPKLSHTLGDWIVDREATCALYGVRHKECLVCGEDAQTESLPKLSYTLGDWIVDRAPTCALDGKKHKECLVCLGKVQTENIPSLPHTESEWITDKESTCSVEGARHKECSVCKKILRKDYLPFLEHTNKITITEPTCSQMGCTTKTCVVCGEWQSFDFIQTLPHTTGEWIIDREPTCFLEGLRHKECLVCGETAQWGGIDKIPHDYKKEIIYVDGSESGYTLYTCRYCGDNYKDDYFQYETDFVYYDFKKRRYKII